MFCFTDRTGRASAACGFQRGVDRPQEGPLMSAMLDTPVRKFHMPNGMSVYGLDANDTRNVYQDVFEDRCYLRHGVELHDGDTVIDVGANTGLFALWLDTQLTSARVHCLEPVPDIYRVLSRNLADHGRLGAEAHNIGLSDHDGEAAFTYYPRFSNASTMFPDASPRTAEEAREYVISQAHTLPWPLPTLVSWCPRWLKGLIAEAVRRHHLRGKRVTCQVRTLSLFLRQHRIDEVDLLKIDAERSESRILAGIAAHDWPKIRQLVVEVHDGEAATQNTVALLTRRGYRAVAEPNPAMPGLSLVYAVK